MRILAVVAAAIWLCCGCAGVTVNSLGMSDEADKEAWGFRFWQPAPFLFVRSDGQGGLSAEIKWLPDTTQKMSARPFAVLASNESKLEFINGVLTTATLRANETEVVKSSLAALAKVFAAAADAPATAPGGVPIPYVYKIVVDNGRIALLGGAAKGLDGQDAVIKAVAPTPGGTP